MNPAEKVNILLVDDLPANLLALESILASPEYRLVRATSGEEALRYLLRQDFAVIVLDVRMPGLDGIETARLIKQREGSQHIPIIFLTATPEEEFVLKGYAAGAVDYLTRPPHPLLLRSKIAAFVDLYKKTEELRALSEDLARVNALLQRRERDLEVKNRELEAFAYSVSHDLKAPLRGMEGFARALQEDCADRLDEAGRRYLDMIRGSARRMGALIDDLLQYSRVERRAMRWEPVDLDRLVRDLLADRQAEIKTRGVRVEVALPFRQIAGEREGLQQALANLLDNALKFTRNVEHPTIAIRGQEGDAERVLSVADNGVGFDPKYREKAFAMFQRLHPQEEYEGTGIGLAIVRKVAERHGGRAWAASEPRKGSTFYLAIPVQIADC